MDVHIAPSGDKWILTNYGTVHFNDLEWKVYLPHNSGLLNNWVNQFVIDQNNIKWFATRDGLVKWDGQEWATFTPSNSILRDELIETIFVDSKNQLWIGLHYDGWIYQLSGSQWAEIPLPTGSSYFVKCFAEDDAGNIRISDHWNLLKFDENAISVFKQNISDH